jgi:ketosteroid isomerase-like protein
MTLAHRFRAWLPLTVSLAFLLPSMAIGQGIERPRVPLRTALDELRVLREAYSEAFNKKETATLVDMYAPDAIVIRGDGTMLAGKDAIRKSFEAGPWSKMSIASDTVRVFGNTAYDVGTVRTSRSGGDEDVSHYLVVLRRGLKVWNISSLAVVPETSKVNPRDSAGH